VLSKEPDILWDVEEEIPSNTPIDLTEINPELVKQMIAYDRYNKRLKDHNFRFMMETLEKPIPWDERTMKYLKSNYEKLKEYGFRVGKK